MSRRSVLFVSIACLGAGHSACWRETKTSETQGAAERCSVEVLAYNYSCAVRVEEHADAEGGTGSGITHLDCGASARFCDQVVQCTCTSPSTTNCGEARLVDEYRRHLRFDGGEGCTFTVRRPRGGGCAVRGATFFAGGGVADWGGVSIPFGRTMRLCSGSEGEVSCRCEDFDPSALCRIHAVGAPDMKGKCAVRYSPCGEPSCENWTTELEPGETREICGKALKCPEWPSDGGEPAESSSNVKE